jgi:hypothetical protein
MAHAEDGTCFLVLEFASTQKSGFYMGKVLSLLCLNLLLLIFLLLGKC